MLTTPREHVSLAPYTIYKIGGFARFFAEAQNVDELQEAIAFAKRRSCPFFILGAGSNVLISNAGFDGVVIRMIGSSVAVVGEELIADAGAMMASVVRVAAQAGLTSFEWAIGIPGTIGGSVRGNAGCFGGSMQDVVARVDIFDAAKNSLLTIPAAQCEFAYRDSLLKRKPEWVAVRAALTLERGDPRAAQEKILAITRSRSEKQDIGTKSCGCVFKNIPWNEMGLARDALCARFPELRPFADRALIPSAFLIDRAGCKGMRNGCAAISNKHANFFINEGGATAEDVVGLIQRVEERVWDRYGVRLVEEIQRVGFRDEKERESAKASG